MSIKTPVKYCDNALISADGEILLQIAFEHENHNTVDIDLKCLERVINSHANLSASLKEMIDMMDCGDEHGYGGEWYIKAKYALDCAYEKDFEFICHDEQLTREQEIQYYKDKIQRVIDNEKT